jgi:hypothetical protein
VYTNNKYPGSEDILFNRSAQINEALKTSNQYTIKKVALSPNGIPAESWLFGGTQTIKNPATGKDEKIHFMILILKPMSVMPQQISQGLVLDSPASIKKRVTAKRR